MRQQYLTHIIDHLIDNNMATISIIAGLLGTDTETLSDFLEGSQVWTPRDLLAFCMRYHASPHYIMWGKGQMLYIDKSIEWRSVPSLKWLNRSVRAIWAAQMYILMNDDATTPELYRMTGGVDLHRIAEGNIKLKDARMLNIVTRYGINPLFVYCDKWSDVLKPKDFKLFIGSRSQLLAAMA